MGIGQLLWGADKVKILFRELSDFAVRIYTEEERSDLQAVISMLPCGALQRSNNTYIESIMCFSESERDVRYAGLIRKKILKKD